MIKGILITAALAISCVNTSLADWTEARCDIYPAGSDQLDKMIPCTFAQSQGHITITRYDGVTHDLLPVDETPGNFVDQDGHAVYRQRGLGDQGVIFRLRDESIFLFLSTTGLYPEDENNPTAPFSTSDFDATTLLPCRAASDENFGSCPAGILRMEDRQASIVVQNQMGVQFTINFMKDYVNATNRQVEASLEGDIWTVKVENGEVYKVPLAAIEGG